MAKRTPLAEKLDELKERIAAAAVKAKRDPAEITLVAVTKTAAPEQIREILQLGVADLGESRVQVLTQRAAQMNEFFQRRLVHGDGTANPKLRWHMIGHLQRNKVKAVLPLVSLIHSIDSLRLAEELDVQATKLGKKVPVLLEVNASEEASKHGVAVGAAVHLAEQIDSMPGLQFMGLMTMGPAGRHRGPEPPGLLPDPGDFRGDALAQDRRSQPPASEHGHERRFRGRHCRRLHLGPHRHRALRREGAGP